MRELLLISVSGIRYGIWKDEVLSVKDVHSLHRLPLSPACIAGISLVDGRTVTLADLPVCIGHESSQGDGQSMLLMAHGETAVGFVVKGEIRTQSLPPELLFPLPEYLKTPVFESCAVLDNVPIPLINIAELLSRVLKADEEPSPASFPIPAVQSLDISKITRIRFFVVGEELYAASAEGMDDKAVRPGPITPLPNTPRFVKGVTFSQGRLLPVIDLSQRIKQQSGAREPVMLIHELGGAAFGLLIDNDEGSLSAEEVAIKPAPPIARSSWLTHVVVRAGELIPLVDLAMALSPGLGAGDEEPLWQRYAPGSGFSALFARQEVEVVEFLLLGVRHALPREEVEDVIAFKPCRELPDAPAIVIGVAGHQGEVLPVVDLAMMFNRRSLSTPEWRMLLVKNGDFRALVITEAVLGERRLSPELQRAVPILLPHHLVYGCYPDADAVRLILNVEAMVVHFEKSLIRKFLPALSQEMRASPAEIVHALLEEKAAGEPYRPAAVTPAFAEEKPVPAPASAAVFFPPVPEYLAKQEQVTLTSAISPEPEQTAVDNIAAPMASSQEPLSTEGERIDRGVLEQNNTPPADTVSEKTIAPEAISEVGPPEITAPGHDVSAQEPSYMDDTEPEPVVMSEQLPGETPLIPTEKDPDTASSQAELQQELAKTGPEALLPIGDVVPASDDSRLYEQEKEQSAVLSGTEERPVDRRRIAYAAIGAALVALLYFAGTSREPGVEKTVKGTASARIEQVRTETVLPRAAEKPRAPLVLEIPANMPVAIEEYVVKEGDTLWSISKRFTGNPFNYPRIAGENRIADSDLIFPGQRIRLQVKGLKDEGRRTRDE